MSEKLRIAIVDNQPIYRDGIAGAVKHNKIGVVVAEGVSTADALEIAAIQQPDIILLDVSIPGNGITAVGAITKSHPQIRTIMLTASEEEETVLAALRAGAHGYVLKLTKGAELARIIRSVHAGESYVAPGLAARLLTRLRPPAPETPVGNSTLTPREDAILKQVKCGHTNKQIANTLSVSEKTVKYYMSSIMQKLNVRNRVEAVMLVRHRDH